LIMTASIDEYVVAPTGSVVGAAPEPTELKRWPPRRNSHQGPRDL
jgi:hypothetical protein